MDVNRNIKIVLYTIWTTFFLLLFATREGVGSDYWAYVNIFENSSDEAVEAAFKIYGYVLHDIIGVDGQFAVAFLAVIMTLLTVLSMRLVNISPIYLPFFFIVNLILYTSILRQGVATIITGLLLFTSNKQKNYLVHHLMNGYFIHKSQLIIAIIKIMPAFKSKKILYVLLGISIIVATVRIPILSSLLISILDRLEINSWRTVYFTPGGRFYVPLHYGKVLFIALSMIFLIRNGNHPVRSVLLVFGFIILFISELGVLSARLLFTYTYLFYMYFLKVASGKNFFTDIGNIFFLFIFLVYSIFSLKDELSVHNGTVYSEWQILI